MQLIEADGFLDQLDVVAGMSFLRSPLRQSKQTSFGTMPISALNPELSDWKPIFQSMS